MTPQTFRRLTSWLPQTWLVENRHRLSTLAVQLESDMQVHLDELGAILDESKKHIEKAETLEALCKAKSDDGSSELDNNPAAKSLNEKVALFDKKLADFKPTDHARTLFHKEIKGDLNQLNRALIANLNASNWPKASDIINQFIGTPHEKLVLDAAIALAIANNAPIDFIVSLLNMGAEIPEDAIRTLSILDYKQLAAGLLRYGLDIHYVNSVGMNGLSYITRNSDDIRGISKMFKFLLDNGVSLKPSRNELDPLNFALMKVDRSKTALYYCQELIKRGAKIDRSHYQQLSILKVSNNAMYQKVIDLIPELAIN